MIYSLEIYLKSLKQLSKNSIKSKSGDNASGLQTPIALRSLLLRPYGSKFCKNGLAICRAISCLDVVVLLQDTLLMLRVVWVSGLLMLDYGRLVWCN